MSRLVYQNGQHNTKAALLDAINDAVKNIDPEFIKNLYSTIRKRLIDVILKKGEVL